MKIRHTLARFALSTLLVLSLVTIPLLLPDQAQAQSSTFSQKAPTATASLIVAGNPVRSAVIIKNVGTVGVAVSNVATLSYSTAVTAGFVIAPNQTIEVVGAKDPLYAITAASTGDLRIWEVKNGAASLHMERLATTGAANNASSTIIPSSDGTDLVNGNVLIYNLSTAITANSTTTSTVSGTLAITSNATGLGSVFRSDGTNWQLLANYSQYATSSSPVTIATTSTSDTYLSAPVSGSLTGIDFSSIDALAASDTNYITWTVVNLGQSGVGTTAMLAVSDANTTKTTGGTALTAFARRALTVHGTAANLLVVKGDVIRIRATATGTLVGAVTGARNIAYFTRSV